jgi:hypothetical protein
MATNRDSATGMSAETLAELIRFLTSKAPCEEAPDLAARAAERLQERLSAPMPSATPSPQRQAPTLLEALTDEHAGLAALTDVKNWAKGLARAGKAEPDHTVVTAVYYCAIAAALLRHGRLITKYRPGELAESFLRLSDALWIPQTLRTSLRDACRRCQELSP